MNPDASEWLPSHLREFPDLNPVKDYQAIASSSKKGRVTKGSELKFTDALRKKQREGEEEQHTPDVGVPEGFVVLAASHKQRSDSMGSWDSTGEDKDGIMFDGEDGGDEDDDEKSLFHTKATMSVVLSKRWIKQFSVAGHRFKLQYVFFIIFIF